VGICLASAGKPLEAVPVMREAVRVFRQCAALHASKRKVLLQNLVGVSSNLANLLAQLGREDEALAVANEVRQTVRFGAGDGNRTRTVSLGTTRHPCHLIPSGSGRCP
jgi:hypothetical protein